MSLEYSINYVEQLEEIRKKLGSLSGEAKNVLRDAINSTARSIRKTMLAQAREHYAESDSAILANKQLKLSTAKGANLTATLRSRGGSLDLTKFAVSPRMPAQGVPVAAKVLEENGMKPIYGEPKPFVVQLRSGHVAVMRRVPGKKYGLSNAGMIRRLLGWDLTKVKKLVTVSTPQMLQDENVTDPAIAMFQRMLPDAIEKGIRKVIKKGG